MTMRIVDTLALSASALALSVMLATAPVAAQAQDDAAPADPNSAAANTDEDEGGATGSAVGPTTEGKIGEEAAANTSTAENFDAMDDATLTTRLSAQGYLNARDFVRSDESISLVADRDGEVVDIVVLPYAVQVTPEVTAQIGGTDDADGGDGGSSAMAEGGSAEGIGDASGTAGGDGGSTSVVARGDAEAFRTQIETMGYANPRDFVWSSDTVWAVADKDGKVVHIYMIPNTVAAQ
jgi:hypothetical protein